MCLSCVKTTQIVGLLTCTFGFLHARFPPSQLAPMTCFRRKEPDFVLTAPRDNPPCSGFAPDSLVQRTRMRVPVPGSRICHKISRICGQPQKSSCGVLNCFRKEKSAGKNRRCRKKGARPLWGVRVHFERRVAVYLLLSHASLLTCASSFLTAPSLPSQKRFQWRTFILRFRASGGSLHAQYRSCGFLPRSSEGKYLIKAIVAVNASMVHLISF